MLLQINPHFLYNTLGSVKSLCMTDPERAADLVQDFSEYLQTKYADINGQQMTSIDRELDVVAQYLRIERVRFPNIRVEYDIMADDFKLPTLSIQPLAENAVRHGIGQRRRNAGTLKISTWETEDAWQVCVEDDGAGFDTGAGLPDDGRRHIGLANVETRLRLLCGGTLTKEKELFAALIHQGGREISTDGLCSLLWDDNSWMYEKTSSTSIPFSAISAAPCARRVRMPS